MDKVILNEAFQVSIYSLESLVYVLDRSIQECSFSPIGLSTLLLCHGRHEYQQIEHLLLAWSSCKVWKKGICVHLKDELLNSPSEQNLIELISSHELQNDLALAVQAGSAKRIKKLLSRKRTCGKMTLNFFN